MKKALLALTLVFGFSGVLRADDVWEHYRVVSGNTKAGLRALQNAAPESLSITSADLLVAEYKSVGEVAQQLGREDLYVWTLNNAMYANIVLFKKLVNYDGANAKINSLSPKSKERKDLVKTLKLQYAKYRDLLDRNNVNEIASRAQGNADEKQWNRIVSNRTFIVDATKFIEK